MSVSVPSALSQWGLAEAHAEFVAQRENEVWKVVQGPDAFALRFHRPGYRSDAELISELAWMSMLADNGLRVPRPVPCSDGAFLGQAGGRRVSLLTWLDGAPIGAVGHLSDGADPRRLCRQIGRAMAELHDRTDAWEPPEGFTRPDWRAEGLLGDSPLWGRFWAHPDLETTERDLLLRVRAHARRDLQRLGETLDRGLIHADLLAENILADGAHIAFIDFDDAAWGYRDFELATLLLKFRDRPYFAEMRAGLCEGYARRRAVSPETLDFMLLLRALTYPGWIAARMDEPGAAERSRRAVATALTLANDYLEGTPR